MENENVNTIFFTNKEKKKTKDQRRYKKVKGPAKSPAPYLLTH
jgi:hypothetical protein